MSSGVRRAWHWLWHPTRPARMPTESWPCPLCGREVTVLTTPMSFRLGGLWLPPGQLELKRLCVRQNGPHPVPPPTTRTPRP
jgi:hypothetical protein